MPEITVCIATIPPRYLLLARALESVTLQTHLPAQIIVEYDHGHTGCAATKNRMLARVETPFVTFLDDDDRMYHTHLRDLDSALEDSGADVAFSIPHVDQSKDGISPFWPRKSDGTVDDFIAPEKFRVSPFVQTCGMLHRTDALREVGGWQPPKDRPGFELYDDWGVILAYLDAGKPMAYLPRVTYEWNIRTPGVPGVEGNTSGDPSRW